DENVVEALDDLSVRLRSLVRGRPLGVPEVINSPRSMPAAEMVLESQRGCGEIAGTNYASDSERHWFLENCIGIPSLPVLARARTCEDIAGTAYFSERERLYFLSECG